MIFSYTNVNCFQIFQNNNNLMQKLIYNAFNFQQNILLFQIVPFCIISRHISLLWFNINHSFRCVEFEPLTGGNGNQAEGWALSSVAIIFCILDCFSTGQKLVSGVFEFRMIDDFTNVVKKIEKMCVEIWHF